MRSDLVFCQAPNSLPKRFMLLIESEQVKIWIRGHTFLRSSVRLTASLSGRTRRRSCYTTVHCTRVTMQGLQPEVAKPWMVCGSWRGEFPVKLTVGFGYDDVVDAGVPMRHQTVAVELPIFVAIGAVPLPVR